MPSNSKFGFSILIGGKEIPEYVHPDNNERILVESILWSTHTYWITVKQYCRSSEEVETQEVPVTPYKVKLYTFRQYKPAWYEVYVDGVKLWSRFVGNGQTRIIDGFPEGRGDYSEMLFSLPRYPSSSSDRVSGNRLSKIGKIEVIQREAVFSHWKYIPSVPQYDPSMAWDYRFSQANKGDVLKVTKSRFCMTTTRKGKFVQKSSRNIRRYDRYHPYKQSAWIYNKYRYYNESSWEDESLKRVKHWKLGCETERLTVEYHMTKTLQDWGVELQSST